jgi:glycolate oxidase FAD binding subunit
MGGEPEHIAPSDVSTLAASVADAYARGRKLHVIGGGTRRLRDAEASAVLSCSQLAGIREFDVAEGVVEVGAGTSIDALQAEVTAAGWHLPLERVAPEGSVGGALGSAGLGLRTIRHRTPRDHVLGLRVVDGTGQVSKCGGRVVKNVTGYDLAKLYVGSEGRLGVIESAWLHLQPRPHRVLQRVVTLSRDPFAIGLMVARRSSASAAWLVAPPQPEADAQMQGWKLHVILEGDAAVCDADSSWLAELDCEAVDDTATAIDSELMAHVLPGASADRLSVRLHVLPTRLHALAMRMLDLGAEVVAAPVPGLVIARWLGEAANPMTLAAVAEAVVRLDGTGCLLSAPPGLEPKGPLAPSAGARVLTASLRERFDPAGILGAGSLAVGV